MGYRGKRKGAVLIVVLGVLAVLALLAVTFATMQATERQVARNYLDTVRAKLLAMSGVEDGISRLKEIFPLRAFNPSPVAARMWKYYGDQVDETQDPIIVPLEKAKNPSFAYEDDKNPTNDSTPSSVKIEGQTRGFSGVMESGTYGNFGDHYALKVSDLSGHIYVNDGVDGGPGGGVSQNLKRILNALGQIKPTVDVPGLGDKILAARPATGYRHIDELLAALGYDKAAFGRVREFVTVQAWVDPNVANPVPLSQALVDYEKSQGNSIPEAYGKVRGGLYRFMHSKDAAGREIVPAAGLNTCPPIIPAADPGKMAGACVYGLDTLNPQWIEIVSRAPVNVNSAPKEVLVALLADLKGFFLTDRRRNNPRWAIQSGSSVAYTSHALGRQNSLSPDLTEGDEVGFLAQTLPIAGPGSTVSGGISAFFIADEIVACRKGGKSPHGQALSSKSVLDYGAPLAWGGPFRSWHQFNQFVDNLVEIGVIREDPSRDTLWVDYPSDNTVDPMGYDSKLRLSAIQKQHAERAIADVLKANFNPNLHLNELNPDENLYTIVDKTDLIVNSTEFCFVPTGYFEIESLGRLLRPKGGGPAADARAGDNDLMARAKVTAVCKLFEITRETTQRQFYAGTLSPTAADTNSGKSLEIGPEPDNGIVSDDTHEWDGVVALPTVGSVFGGNHGAPAKPKDTLRTTLSLPSSQHLGSAFHVHFALDFDAHHHVIDRREIAGVALPADDSVSNFPDGNLSYGGPYDPTKGGGNVHRLAKSFRLKPGSTTPSLAPFAPSDLRIDGGYSERHAAPAYLTSTAGAKIWNFNNENARGMVSFWMKPSFDPERTGKIRMPWDLSRYHEWCWTNTHVYPFAVWFFPVHHDAAKSEVNDPLYDYIEAFGQLHPSSLAYGHMSWHMIEPVEPSMFGNLTTSLNHFGHPDQSSRSSLLRSHRWINITFSWHLPGGTLWYSDQEQASSFYVNGSAVYVPYSQQYTMQGYAGTDKMYFFDRHDPAMNGVFYGEPSGTGDYNHIRLGAPSRIADAAVVQSGQDDAIFPGATRGNHSADCTLDELYVWKEAPETAPSVNPQMLWRRGRYSIPKAGEGMFTSQAIVLTSSSIRLLAPPSSVASPPLPAPIPGTVPLGSPAGAIRVLGLAWTWYGEATDAAGKRALYDYNTPDGSPGPDLKPRVKLAILDPAVPSIGFDDDGFSAVRASDGSIPVLQNPQQLRYTAQFVLENADPLNTILLATPVLDDVTIYWDEGQAQVVSYVLDNRSF